MSHSKSDNNHSEEKWKTFAKEQKQTEDTQQEHASEAASTELTENEADTITRLENHISALELQLDDFKNEALRARADADNVRRRCEKDIEKAHHYGNEKLIKALLPVIDSLVRGLEGCSAEDASLEKVREGMQLTLALLEDTLAKFGVEAIAPEQGEAFNPELHEAMSAQPHPELSSNQVVAVLQKGYQLNGRVIRAAMVIVCV